MESRKDKSLIVIKGEEFKLNLKEQIDESDIFYDQYLEAAEMLNDIVTINGGESGADWRNVETENNIIAFCGDRGEGKSSTMMTFMNALLKSGTIFNGGVKNTVFSKPVVIDPSMFDDVHNILEVIIASLFREFRAKYEKDSRAFDDYKREKLLEKFQEVYRIISLMNNPQKMLEEEFDGEANITNLSRMGEGTELKGKVQSLIKTYLDCMIESGSTENKKLLIAIDDLDLCNASAYKMAEQIRKYFIIPNVVIVMALKVEQLSMCVQEENFRNYKNILQSGNQPSEFYEEVKNMAEKYIAKLLPGFRRIYLPNVRNLTDIKITYKDKNEKIIYEGKLPNSMSASILDMVYAKTGMRFLLDKQGANWLQPDNLRETVNMITLLGNMQDPTYNTEYYENIEKFARYFERQWIPQNASVVSVRELQNLLQMPYLQMNSEVIYLLNQNDEVKNKGILGHRYYMEKNNCFFWVLKWINVDIFDKKYQKLAYTFQILYTIRLSELYRTEKFDDLSDFIGGYVWGDDFNGVLPGVNFNGQWVGRARFELPTAKVYNILSGKIAKVFSAEKDSLDETKSYISKLNEHDLNREYKIFNWLMTGLLCNTYYVGGDGNLIAYHYVLAFEATQVIYSNYVLIQNVQLCIENYIVGLCNLNAIYKKINMQMLGIGKKEFKRFTENIEKNNVVKIGAFRRLFTNIDLMNGFLRFCFDNREIKEGGEKDEYGRTKAAVDRFFRNAEIFLKKYKIMDARSEEKLNLLILEDSTKRKYTLNISECFAELFQNHLEYLKNNPEFQKQKLMQEFDNLMIAPQSINVSRLNVASYLVTKFAQNAKKNLDNLVSHIRNYYWENPENGIMNLNKEKLRNCYSKVLDYYTKTPEKELSKELCQEYKETVKEYSKFIKR